MDYPGKVAAVVFTQGCNFRCPYCHNRALWQCSKNTSFQSFVINYLETHRQFLDGVVITGGEPTMQKDIFQFAEKIKSLGLLVKLDTNGSYPEVIKRLLEHRLIDYIAMDIKSVLTPQSYSLVAGVPIDAEQLEALRISLNLILASGIEYEFRTTMCREYLQPQNIVDLCVSTVQNCCHYYLQVCRSHQFHQCQPYLKEELELIRQKLPSTTELQIR